ncbi:ATP-grasp domain-containing protein [Metabacillus malikii]|uniref:Glutathione synthase/RimK-type ligase-like ATP-grasp enzyme n=1 Tax=Metabacillus malikii TaxID=1504265 RepID=A0ABT9ZFN0_9BACI|nr:ATP-grasp domain-containing protein [Metabacillus malikii]MDQ0230373.1 glutathione synthase/RimK-type ligase-like ATP-grasp enzyme [Metabacillus malikii]
MNQLSVGIIGSNNERHSVYLKEEIERQGAHAFILDNSPDKPYPLSFTEHISDYENHPLSDTKVYFLRALFLPSPAFDSSGIKEKMKQEGYAAYSAERERYAAWLSWLKTAPYQGRTIINPVDTLLIHFAKPYHLEVLRAADIPVPKTLVTGNPSKLLEFSKGRKLIYKPVAGGALCRLLTDEDKDPERLKTLVNAPVQFQEYIEGDDIRVFVLGGKVIASFLVEGEGIDYREKTTSVKPFPLTKEISNLCIRACHALGLTFSGVDLKLRPDGSVVCIECNPSPMFEGFDQVAPVSIVSQLAAYLIDIAKQAQPVHMNELV